jgi:hypothetical protein
MFKPLSVPNFERKINSMYKAGITMNGGAAVDIDVTDTSAITGSYGYSALSAGSVKLATPATVSATQSGRELGYALVDVTPTGPSVIERILRLATSYLKIPMGLNVAVYIPTPGDIFATTEFVGNLAGDSALTGYINVNLPTALGITCEIFNGRLRAYQASTSPARAQFLGQTTSNGSTLAMFRVL